MTDLVNWVMQKFVDRVLIQSLVVVDGHIRLLFQDVVKSGSPFSAAQSRCVGAVVHHEGNPSGMHVRVQTVCSLNDTFIADLAVWVTLHS